MPQMTNNLALTVETRYIKFKTQSGTSVHTTFIYLKAFAHKIQQRIQGHDLSNHPVKINGPLDAGYTKSQIWGHALSSSVDY